MVNNIIDEGVTFTSQVYRVGEWRSGIADGRTDGWVDERTAVIVVCHDVDVIVTTTTNNVHPLGKVQENIRTIHG